MEEPAVLRGEIEVDDNQLGLDHPPQMNPEVNFHTLLIFLEMYLNLNSIELAYKHKNCSTNHF